MTNEKGKSPRESAVETRYLIMPHQANAQGTNATAAKKS